MKTTITNSQSRHNQKVSVYNLTNSLLGRRDLPKPGGEGPSEWLHSRSRLRSSQETKIHQRKHREGACRVQTRNQREIREECYEQNLRLPQTFARPTVNKALDVRCHGLTSRQEQKNKRKPQRHAHPKEQAALEQARQV